MTPNPSREIPDLAPLIDHALLDPHQGLEAIQRCCDEARHFGFAGVCVASRWVQAARERLPLEGSSKGRTPKLISVVGFPFGAVPAAIKRAEAEHAAAAGADELDVVPDFGALADGDGSAVLADLAPICELGVPVKVIVEVGRLSREALALVVEVSIDAGARFLKSGSGFGPPVTPTRWLSCGSWPGAGRRSRPRGASTASSRPAPWSKRGPAGWAPAAPWP